MLYSSLIFSFSIRLTLNACCCWLVGWLCLCVYVMDDECVYNGVGQWVFMVPFHYGKYIEWILLLVWQCFLNGWYIHFIYIEPVLANQTNKWIHKDPSLLLSFVVACYLLFVILAIRLKIHWKDETGIQEQEQQRTPGVSEKKIFNEIDEKKNIL